MSKVIAERSAKRGIAAAAILAMVAGIVSVPAAAPAQPQPAVGRISQVDLAYFQERLAPFGHWFVHPVWGEVWRPDAGPDFRPYFFGNWEYTSDYGWLWVSNEPYGDIVYHYGRWVFDPDNGWLWVPGYVWAPSWVVWRETDGYVGWLPMPPDYADFDTGAEQPVPGPLPDLYYGYDGFYGAGFVGAIYPTLWLFCADADFGRRDRRRYVTDHRRLHDLYDKSHDHTHYEHDRGRDHIVDHSIDPKDLERNGHAPLVPLPAARFLRRDVPITSVSLGREIFRREHDRTAAPAGANTGSAVIAPPRRNALHPFPGRSTERRGPVEADIPHTDNVAPALPPPGARAHGPADSPPAPVPNVHGGPRLFTPPEARRTRAPGPALAGPTAPSAAPIGRVPSTPAPAAIVPPPAPAPAAIAPPAPAAPAQSAPQQSAPGPRGLFGSRGNR